MALTPFAAKGAMRVMPGLAKSYRIVMHLRLFLLAIAAMTASGCKADIGGVTSINKATDAASDISVSFYTIDDQGQLISKHDSDPKLQLPQKTGRELRITSQYDGLTVEDALALAQRQGLELRVVEEGGPRHADWHSHRITVDVKNGIVQSAKLDNHELSLEDHHIQ